MIYIKSVLVGFAVAAAAMIAWLFGEMVVLVPQIRYMSMAQTGSGGIGAVSTVSYVPFVGVVGFALGYYFTLRKLRPRVISK